MRQFYLKSVWLGVMIWLEGQRVVANNLNKKGSFLTTIYFIQRHEL